MKTPNLKAHGWLAALCGSLLLPTLSAQTSVDSFEYATNDDLLAYWTPSGNASVSVSDLTAFYAEGESSMRIDFNFPSSAWATEWVTGADLPAPISIGPDQSISLRLKGDPAFAAANFKNFYLYAYDTEGRFGRWGAEVPTSTDWEIFNFDPDSIDKPWDSPELPDLSQITRFSIFQYGSGETPIDPYAASIYVDELSIRDTPLEDPEPPAERLVEGFEYSDDESLRAAWSSSANATLSLSDAVAPLSGGEKALNVAFNFPSMAWATETFTGPTLETPVAIQPGQYVSFRVKGDPAFAASDFSTLFLYAYDSAGNFGRWGADVPETADWQVFNFAASDIQQPWDSTGLPNMQDIVRFAFFQYGSEGELPEYSANVQVDDLQILNEPLVELPTTPEMVLESFEYETEDELLFNWTPGTPNAVITLSDEVSPNSEGSKSMKVEFNFTSTPWVTEIVRGPLFPEDLVLAPEQYITFRLKGDPAFAAANFRDFYLYVYDINGNFARWGTAVPVSEDWQVVNFRVGAMQLPWDSPGMPDLNHILSFAIYQYGSNETPVDPYTATIHVDDLMVRNAPLVELAPPSDPRVLIDDFEGYANTAELLEFYDYVNSPAATVTTATLASPAPQGDKALQFEIQFAPGRYPWGSVRSPIVEPFSIPENAVVSLRFKGDPALASVADGDTTFWLTFYDEGGRPMNYIVTAPVTVGEWTTLEADLADFGNTSLVDKGNIVQWRILVQGWNGTAETPGMTATFMVDDIRIEVPSTSAPALSIQSEAGELSLTISGLRAGGVYELWRSTDLVGWSKVTDIVAGGETATWPVEETGDQAFFKVLLFEP